MIAVLVAMEEEVQLLKEYITNSNYGYQCNLCPNRTSKSKMMLNHFQAVHSAIDLGIPKNDLKDSQKFLEDSLLHIGKKSQMIKYFFWVPYASSTFHWTSDGDVQIIRLNVSLRNVFMFNIELNHT